MLTFYAELDGAGSYITREIVIIHDMAPQVGFSFPGYLVGPKRNVLLEKRSSLDYLKTGKAKFARDHDCNNLQIFANVAVPITLEGQYLQPFDLHHGIGDSQWHEPSTFVGYNISDVMAAFGTVYDATKMWNFRDSTCHYCDRSSLTIPFIFGRGYVRTYSARMTRGTTNRFVLTSTVGVAYSVPTAVKERPMFVFHDVVYVRQYTSTGKLYRSSWGATTYVLAAQPTTEDGTIPSTAWLRPVDQVWTSSWTPYTCPTILTSMSEATMNQVLLTPSMLYGVTKVNPSVALTLRRWGAVSLDKTLTAKCDSDYSTLFRYDDAITTYVWQRLYLRKNVTVPPEWGELGDTAADNINQVSINSLAYMRDLRTSLDSLRATVALAKNPSNPKSWTSWWLSMRYGDRLTYRDTIELSKAVASNIVSRSKGWNKDYYTSQACDSATEYSIEDNSSMEVQRFIKLYYKPKWDDWVSKTIVASMKWDLWPTLGNSWDLIPFSFVVDWFVDVESILEKTDRQNLMLMHTVLSVVQTEKRIYTFDDAGVDDLWVTNFKAVAYLRQISRSLPTSPFRVDRGHLASINIIDGISLLFQA